VVAEKPKEDVPMSCPAKVDCFWRVLTDEGRRVLTDEGCHIFDWECHVMISSVYLS
jgi:hypothetical protein